MDSKIQLTKIVCTQLGLEDTKSIEKHHNLIWQNPRKKSQGGLRLTDLGYSIFTDQLDIKKYEIDFPKEFTMTNQITIWLDKFIDSPYYITKKSIIVFKEKTAVQLILFSGDVEKFGLAKAIQSRETQHEN